MQTWYKKEQKKIGMSLPLNLKCWKVSFAQYYALYDFWLIHRMDSLIEMNPRER